MFAYLHSQGQEATQVTLFQKAKFALFLVDNFVPFPPPRSFDDDDDDFSSDSPTSRANAAASSNSLFVSELGHMTAAKQQASGSDLLIRRAAARGLVMNCANAVRLQLTVQSPSAFLSVYLSQHQKWNEFLPFLTVQDFFCFIFKTKLLIYLISLIYLQESTEIQIRFGMGIKISMIEPKPSTNSINESIPTSNFPISLLKSLIICC